MLTSNAMLKLPSPNVTAETHTVYLLYKGAYSPAVLPGNSLFNLTLAGCQRNQAVQKSYLYGPHVARGYRVKLQRWEYTEQCTPENNDNNNEKSQIRLTSVGLAHARPINWTLVYNYFTFVFNKYIVPWWLLYYFMLFSWCYCMCVSL